MKNLQQLRDELNMGFITNTEYLSGVLENLRENDNWRLEAALVHAMDKALDNLTNTWESLIPGSDEIDAIEKEYRITNYIAKGDIIVLHCPSNRWIEVRDGHTYDPNTQIRLDGIDYADGALIWAQRNA